jgi:hypothetical protein
METSGQNWNASVSETVGDPPETSRGQAIAGVELVLSHLPPPEPVKSMTSL